MAKGLRWLRREKEGVGNDGRGGRLLAGAGSGAPEGTAPLPAPIFISGCNRGGTTITASLLGRHPEVCNVGAGHAFSEGQYVWRLKFPDPSHHRWAVEPWRSQMRKSEADATPALVEFFRYHFAAAVAGQGRLLEKTPANAVRIPFIDACFPGAYFVHIVRDGRDTVCSLLARKVAFKYAPLQWVGAHQTALADLERLSPERVTVVRYEEFLAEPARVLCEISRRCGLRVDDEVRALFAGIGASELRNPASRWPRLSPRQQRYAMDLIGDMQRRLGYPVE
jgi:hypothetical protein